MFKRIKEWYANLPDKASGKFQLDKQILKSTKENILVSASITLVGILTSFLDKGFGTTAIVLGAGVFLKDFTRILIKFIKDYSDLE